MNWVYLFIAIFAEVIATSALKPANGFTQLWPSVLVILGYGTSFFFLSLAIKSIPIAIAYSVWCGVGVALVSLIAWQLFGQSLSVMELFGITLICAGVVVLNVFSKVTN